MSLTRDFIKFLSVVTGLAKDLTEDTAKWYANFLRRGVRWFLITLAFSAVLASVGMFAHSPKLLAAGILLFTLATVAAVILAFPLVELGAYAIELGVGKRTLRVIGLLSGWGVFIALVAYTAPADSGLFNRVLIAGLTFFVALLLMGLESTRKMLGVKLAIILAVMTFGVFLPRTNLMVTNVVAHIDRNLSEVLDPTFNEVELSLATLDSTKFFASDGTPLSWCRVDRARPAGYRCFDRGGHDPNNKEILRPVTPEMIEVVRSQLKRASPPAPQPRADSGIANPTARASQASPPSRAPEADYVNSSATRNPTHAGKPRWTIVAWDVTRQADGRLNQDIRQIGAVAGLGAPISTLKSSFVDQGVSKRVLEGDVGPLTKAELVQFTDYLVLAEYAAKPHNATAGEPLKAVTGEIRLLVIRLKDMQTSEPLYVREGDAGANFRDAGELAYQRLLISLKPQLSRLLQGFIK